MGKISAKPALGALDATSVILGNKAGGTGRYNPSDLSRGLGHVLRLEQVNASATTLELARAAGAVYVHAEQELAVRAVAARTGTAGVTVLYPDIVDEERPLVYGDGSEIVDSAWAADQELRLAFNPDGPHAGKYQLLSPPKPPASRSYYVPLVKTGGTANSPILAPAPGVGLPNNTAALTRFRYRLEDSQAEGAMSLRVTGINDADPLQLLQVDKLSQIPDSALPAGTIIEFERVPDGQYHLVDALPAAQSVPSREAFYTMRLLQIAAAN